MSQANISVLWQPVAVFMITASFGCLVLILTKYRGYHYGLHLIARALLFVIFLAGGFVDSSSCRPAIRQGSLGRIAPGSL